MARITQQTILDRIDYYERTYGFTRNNGWNQVVKDLKPPVGSGPHRVPRAIAYGGYMELLSLLGL